jgi:hypothetical protein
MYEKVVGMGLSGALVIFTNDKGVIIKHQSESDLESEGKNVTELNNCHINFLIFFVFSLRVKLL